MDKQGNTPNAKVCATCNSKAKKGMFKGVKACLFFQAMWQKCKSFIYNSKGEPGHCPDEPEDSPDDHQKEIPNLNGTEIEKEHWGFCDMGGGGCNQRPCNLLADQLMETDLKVMKQSSCLDQLKGKAFNPKDEMCVTGTFKIKLRQVIVKGSKFVPYKTLEMTKFSFGTMVCF